MAKYGINKAILVGNLGKDPELRSLDSGTAVATFTLATTERFRNREGQSTEKTEWHNVVMWRKMAETFSKHLRKGSTVYVEGRIVTRSWQQDGVTRYRTEIEAKDLVMLDGRTEGVKNHSQSSIPASNFQSESVESGVKRKMASEMPLASSDELEDLSF